jgi:hypothetical protein
MPVCLRLPAQRLVMQQRRMRQLRACLLLTQWQVLLLLPQQQQPLTCPHRHAVPQTTLPAPRVTPRAGNRTAAVRLRQRQQQRQAHHRSNQTQQQQQRRRPRQLAACLT